MKLNYFFSLLLEVPPPHPPLTEPERKMFCDVLQRVWAINNINLANVIKIPNLLKKTVSKKSQNMSINIYAYALPTELW